MPHPQPLAARFAPLALLAAACPFAAAQGFDLPPTPEASRAVEIDASTLEISQCVVRLVDSIELAAPEAGVLTHVGIERGSRFKSEAVLAKIDTREAEVGYKVTGYQYKLALKRAQDEIEEEYAQAQRAVELADYEAAIAANKIRSGSVPEQDVRRERLEFDRARLGVDKAVKDQEMAFLEADVKRAEMEAAMIAIEKRQVRAPFDGEVLRLHREQGEWVQPGEVIAEIASFETMQVDGWVYLDEFGRDRIKHCRVTVEAPVGPNRVEQAKGYIVYIDPLIEYDGRRARYRVRAEISNRQEAGDWLISPNLVTTMRIHLGTADPDAVSQRRAASRRAN